MSDWSSDVCSSDLLSMLARIYDMRRMEVPPFVQAVLARAVPALLGLTHSDGGMGRWQGSGATSAAAIQAIVQASGVRQSGRAPCRESVCQDVEISGVAGS